MIVHIFFSLFDSPTSASGSVSGDFEIEPPLERGREVDVLQPKEGEWFGGSLKIETITQVPGQDKLLVELQDVVAKSRDDAPRLGERFEAEAGLFWDPYH